MTSAPFVSPKSVPQAFWEKYSTRAPRYTSYPTAPNFTEDFDRDEARKRWVEGWSTEQPISLYVHVPFCKKRCLYCGCHTFIRQDRSISTAYVDDLLREMDRMEERIGPGRPVEQLAMGGGTPTFLPVAEMRRMVEEIDARFGFVAEGERSIEIDPRSVDEEMLDTLVELGFNRFSFGIQDFDPTVMEYVGRPQDEASVVKHLEFLWNRGVEGINFDLIFGLPGQSETTMQRTAERVAELRPSRIALFSYAHLPRLKPHQKTLEKQGLPGDAEKIAIFAAAFDALTGEGYVPVGMDHFARTDDPLYEALQKRSLHRNFMGYTTMRGRDLVALGVSAISSVHGTYTQNLKDLDPYRETLADDLPWMRGYLMTEEDRLRREIILDLFCNFHLEIGRYEQSFGIDFWKEFHQEKQKLEAFRADDLMDFDDREIRVHAMGRFFIRNICTVFDRFLSANRQNVQFSKTV